MTSEPTLPAVGRLVTVAVVLVLVAGASSAPVAAHTGDDGTHHHDGWMSMHDGMGWGVWGGFGLLWMFLWGLLLVGVPLGLGYLLLTRRGPTDGGSDDALALLRRRYAQGEIDEEEFEARRRKLLADTD